VEKQHVLFNIPRPSIRDVLLSSASRGRLFYSVRQVADLLGISGFRVYYLVYNYRLDALLIGGEYRIPWTAVLDWMADREEIARQYFDYLAYIEEREVKGSPGFLKNHKGIPTLPMDLPVGSELLSRIRKRQLPAPRSLVTTEADPLDWYALEDLHLPLSGTAAEWAALFSVNPSAITEDSQWNEASVIEYPEMLDWMIEREVVNLPVPYRFVTPKKIDREGKGQLWLFG
jgi:excisionase family DNA binding protein